MRLSARHQRELELIKKSQKKVLKGWAIIRVSKENLAQNGSPEQQQNMINDWVERKKYETKKVYKIEKVINEETSGRYQNTRKRKDLLNLIEHIKNDKVDFIVAERMDRISRDDVLNLEIMRLVREKGVEYHEVNHGRIDFRDRGQRMSYKYRNVEASEYSEGVSENIDRKQLTSMVHNGKDPSPCPTLGLDYHPRWVGYYVLNKKEIKVLKEIFDIAIKRGINGAVKYCNEKNILTKEWWTKEKVKNGERVPSRKMGGQAFNSQSMLQLLKNSKIRGHGYFVDAWDMFPQQRNKEKVVRWEYWHRKEFGPIIPDDVIEKVDLIINGKKKRRPRNNNFILAGVLEDKDGSKYRGEAAKSGKNLYYYNRESNKRLNTLEINDLVIERLKKIIEEDGFLDVLIERMNKSENILKKFAEERKVLKEKIAEAQHSINNFSSSIKTIVASAQDNLGSVIQAMIDEKQESEIKLEEFKSELESLDKREKSFKVMSRGKNLKKYLNEAFKSLKSAHPMELKTIINICIGKGIIFEKGNSSYLELKINLDIKPNKYKSSLALDEGETLGFSENKKATFSSHYHTDMVEEKKWPFYVNGGR